MKSYFPTIYETDLRGKQEVLDAYIAEARDAFAIFASDFGEFLNDLHNVGIRLHDRYAHQEIMDLFNFHIAKLTADEE